MFAFSCHFGTIWGCLPDTHRAFDGDSIHQYETHPSIPTVIGALFPDSCTYELS